MERKKKLIKPNSSIRCSRRKQIFMQPLKMQTMPISFTDDMFIDPNPMVSNVSVKEKQLLVDLFSKQNVTKKGLNKVEIL